LLELLHESYDRFAWHGPNLTQALDGVDAAQANWWPPSAGIVIWNIREIARHAGNVMRRCGRDLLEGGVPSFRDDEEDERRVPLAELTNDEDWAKEVKVLHDSFVMLRKGVSEAAPTRLMEVSPSRAYEKEWTFSNYIYGVALHNVYHAAQIVSLRKRQGTWTEWQP
jgi:hypothetical protein